MKIFVVGANGMIGSGIFSYLETFKSLKVYPLIRSSSYTKYLPKSYLENIIVSGNLENIKEISYAINQERPDILINCAGITKHLPESSNYKKTITLNSLFPHLLAGICSQHAVKLIQISTDCIFSGKKGNYSETDIADPIDLYGKSKNLGEVDYDGHLTIRTSTIGHEINTKNGLLEWFLSENSCLGYEKAIFSGITTIELAKIIYEIILQNDSISGIYHISSVPINKYALLKLIAKVYQHEAIITRDKNFIIDRSLNSERFRRDYGYQAPSWEDMISTMYSISLFR